MRQRIGIPLVVATLVLTWPLHIGAACYLLAEVIGDYFMPHKDHVLFWFPIAGGGCVLLVLLVVGVFMHKRFAIYGSVLAMFWALWTLARFPVHSRVDGMFELALAILLFLSAVYLWRMAEQVKINK